MILLYCLYVIGWKFSLFWDVKKFGIEEEVFEMDIDNEVLWRIKKYFFYGYLSVK